MGYDSTGWDYYWFKIETPKPADVVTLTYVINTIEEPLERVQVLQNAFSLASTVLVISVPNWCNKGRTPYGDGFVSQWNVFNKHYSQSELTKFVERTINCKSHRLGQGIVAVYKQDYHCYSPSEVSDLKAELLQLKQEWVPGVHVFLERYRSSYYFYYRLRSPIADLPGTNGNCKVLHLGVEGSDRHIWATTALERRQRVNRLEQEILLCKTEY